MEALTAEVDHALSLGLYVLAIMGALALPDVCAALESANGEATPNRYMNWCRTWFTPTHPDFTARDLWSMRCGVVHQGRFGHPKSQYGRVIFTLPNTQRNYVHNTLINDALHLSPATFCGYITDAVAAWYAAKQSDRYVVANWPRLIRFYPDGLPPYITGMPIIA